MSKNKIRDISNISNSTVIIGDNNQSANDTKTIEDIFLEAKQIIIYYKDEQEEKKKKLKNQLFNSLKFIAFIFFVSVFCYFFFPEETPITIVGFVVSLIGTGLSIYSYLNGLETPNQTQRDYSDRYNEIIRILEYNRQQDLVSELKYFIKSYKR